MRKIIIFCFVFIFLLEIKAQESIQKEFLLNRKSNTIGLGSFTISDPYLSPLAYTGFGLKIITDSKRLLSKENKNISIQNRLNLAGGMLYNPTNTSALIYAGINYQFGAYYHFRPLENLLILGGSALDLDLGYKYIPRNINNPLNTDLSSNLNLSGIAFYNIPTRKRILKLQLSLQSPLIGCMFVPEIGASYYEMLLLSNFQNSIHLSSIHNKRGLKSELLIHVPFNHSNWHFGVGMNLLKYSANEMVFKNNEFNLLLGTSFDIIKFAGSKKNAPSNFISPVE